MTAFATRERRILLWLVAGTVCWRWLLAVRTPLPRAEAVADLWLAQELAAGEASALAEIWFAPFWSLLLSMPVAFGFDPFEAAMVAGSILAGLALVPVACAAQRMRAGAGVAAALLLFTVPQPALLTAGGSAAAWQQLLTGTAIWLVLRVRRRALARTAAVLCLLLALIDSLRDGLFGCLSIGMVVAALVAGVGLARLPVRLRDLLLTLAVAGMFFLTWEGVESRSVGVERYLGEFLADRLLPEERIATDLPRVQYFAGRRPEVVDRAALRLRVRDRATGAAVLTKARALELDDELRPDFGHFQLSPRFASMADRHGVTVLLRRE
ncbi:MAG: hypothetical protein NXI31_06980 [bacterium]|nr:hypothetical protein [bacterium]